MKKVKMCLLITIATFFTIINNSMTCPLDKCYQVASKYSEPGQPTVLLCGDPGAATCCITCDGGRIE